MFSLTWRQIIPIRPESYETITIIVNSKIIICDYYVRAMNEICHIMHTTQMLTSLTHASSVHCLIYILYNEYVYSIFLQDDLGGNPYFLRFTNKSWAFTRFYSFAHKAEISCESCSVALFSVAILHGTQKQHCAHSRTGSVRSIVWPSTNRQFITDCTCFLISLHILGNNKVRTVRNREMPEDELANMTHWPLAVLVALHRVWCAVTQNTGKTLNVIICCAVHYMLKRKFTTNNGVCPYCISRL